MLTWSHSRFAAALSAMAEPNGVLGIRCNESYTSKTCTNCGHIHNRLGGAKIFQCPNCGFRLPRDVNGEKQHYVASFARYSLHRYW